MQGEQDEIWKLIVGFAGHMVSNLGRVKSIDHITSNSGHDYRVKGKIRKIGLVRGYCRVQLTSQTESKMVHQLVARAFIPMIEGKDFVNHINGIKTDNRVENLEWVTNQENMSHAFNNGLMNPPAGSNHWNSKLDETQVKTIKICLRDGMTAYKLARYFNVSDSSVAAIKSGKAWREVSL